MFKGNNSLANAKILLEKIPVFFKNEIKVAIFINNRRWDINLKNGLYLKIAENDILRSVENYYKIYNSISDQELQKIDLIDLRMPKKAILKFKDSQND